MWHGLLICLASKDTVQNWDLFWKKKLSLNLYKIELHCFQQYIYIYIYIYIWSHRDKHLLAFIDVSSRSPFFNREEENTNLNFLVTDEPDLTLSWGATRSGHNWRNKKHDKQSQLPMHDPGWIFKKKYFNSKNSLKVKIFIFHKNILFMFCDFIKYFVTLRWWFKEMKQTVRNKEKK